jgi:putative tryptophan/tyrosine transport system substrate-binding protein
LWFASRRCAEALRELGYIEGTTIALELRFAEGKFERLPELAKELVASSVDIIVANGTPATMAAKEATNSIPIIMVSVSHPVTRGIVASLARPGSRPQLASGFQGARKSLLFTQFGSHLGNVG